MGIYVYFVKLLCFIFDQIIFEATATGPEGDIALDDIEFQHSQCMGKIYHVFCLDSVIVEPFYVRLCSVYVWPFRTNLPKTALNSYFVE